MGYHSFRNQTAVNKTQAGLSLTRDVKGTSNTPISVQIFCNISQININTIFFYYMNLWPLAHMQINLVASPSDLQFNTKL